MNEKTKDKGHNIHAGHRQRIGSKLDVAPGILSDHELLEIFLFECLPRVDTNPIAHRLLDTFGSFSGVLNASVKELCLVDGIGISTARHIVVSGEMLRRAMSAQEKTIRINSYENIKPIIEERFKDLQREKFEIFCVDKNKRLMSIQSVSDYHFGKVSVPPKVYADILTITKPYGIFLVHNHPSGDATPSKADDEALSMFMMLANFYGVQILDCLIYADNTVFSYKNSGDLEKFKKYLKG